MEPGNTPPPVVLLRMMTGYWQAKALAVAADLGLADLLRDGPRTAASLAEICNVDAGSLHRLLRALASAGVFAQTESGSFALTPMADLLRSDRPDSMRALARMYGSEQYQAWGGLLDSVRDGMPAFDHVFGSSYFAYLAAHPDASSVFNDAMTGWTAQLSDAVAAAYDFSGPGLVVDVGGGTGLLLATILQAGPALRGTLLELSHVAEQADAYLRATPIGNRCAVAAGDFFAAVPGGGSFYVLAQILHDWDDGHCATILRNCRQAMLPGAKLLIIEQVIPPRNEPSLGKWLDLHMLVLLGGRERTEAEYAALLSGADLKLGRVIPTAAGASILEAAAA
jgi:O-methyltransferase domain/Dimerisation domain